MYANRTPEEATLQDLQEEWHASVNLTGSGVPRNFVRGGGVQQIQLRTEDRDLGAVAP